MIEEAVAEEILQPVACRAEAAEWSPREGGSPAAIRLGFPPHGASVRRGGPGFADKLSILTPATVRVSTFAIPGLALPVVQLRDEVSEWQRRWEPPATVSEEIREEAAARDPRAAVEEEPWMAISLDELSETTDLPLDEDVWVLKSVPELEQLVIVPQVHKVQQVQVQKAPVQEVQPVQTEQTAKRKGPNPKQTKPTQSKPRQPKPVQPKPRQPKPGRPQPVQDEWGFFDPDQCGFAALLAKLDEIADEDDGDNNTETTVRVIAY